MARTASALTLLLLAACGRQAEPVPAGGAAAVDPRIESYYESELDGPMKAPGDTDDDEGPTRVEGHRHRSDMPAEPPAALGADAAYGSAETDAAAGGGGPR